MSLFNRVLLAAVSLLLASAAQAETWPSRLIKAAAGDSKSRQASASFLNVIGFPAQNRGRSPG